MNLAQARDQANQVELLTRMQALFAEVDAGGRERFARWHNSLRRRAFIPGAWNFAAYLALRQNDLRPIQTALMPLGLSSLGRCEGRVRPNLCAVIEALAARCAEPSVGPATTARAFFRGERLLRAETARVFGPQQSDRAVRIMVTLPSQAAEDADFITELVGAGMDAARINCAHDDVDAWRKMVANVRAAEKHAGRRCSVYADLAGPKVRTLEVHVRHDARIHVGDRIALVRTFRDAQRGTPAMICTLPAIFDRLRAGDPVWIDDGKIGCMVRSVQSSGAELEVTQASERGNRLRPDKGLNFPKTAITAPALSAADCEALAAILDSIDVVGYSFVRRASDIATLQDELTRLGRPQLPLALKIETLEGVNNLPELIVQAAGRQPTAVMIARGDLAVEIGYRRLAEMQEEILWLCEAASIPVIWATQVLDEFVKTGIPTRAEITDAAMAERAECVMLNKGTHVVAAVKALDELLPLMEAHHTKKTSRMRALHSWPVDEPSAAIRTPRDVSHDWPAGRAEPHAR
jgi:pyruvate kinase